MRRWLMVCLLAACSSAKPAERPRKETAMFASAEDYERFMGRWSRLLAPQLVAFAGVQDGDRVLDIGSGTGVLSFAIRDTTKQSQIAGIDPSPEFVAYANAHDTDPRTTFSVGDAQQLAFADSSFDKTLSLLVVNFIPDRDKAIDEMIRVTKPGGTVAAAVWDYGNGMEMFHVFWEVARSLDPAAPSEAQMPLTKDGELAAKFKAHGLGSVEQRAIVADQKFASFDDYWQPFGLRTGPAGAYIATLTPERRAALEAALRKRLVGEGPDHGFELHSRAWAVKGVVAK